ncbi:histidine kinase [Paenibacillus sp. MWE-103]|uniref:histidine kinase n=1 Tax=Paenibacillus artemisiicola TaxID=1172618 RepID=A0ABS3W804_9BACL|nr:histidine kinase [Paenibacillus artemisiicola]MBO7744440.1 histidine kinase [Paenibacillus artemisiicola]
MRGVRSPSPLLGRLKFRWQLFISFLFISLSIIALTAGAYQMTMRDRILKQSTGMLNYIVEQTAHNIETRLQYYTRMSTFLLSDQNFMNDVQNDDPDEAEPSYENIKNYISAMMYSNVASLAHIALYSQDRNLIKDGDVTLHMEEDMKRQVYDPLRLDSDNIAWKPTWKDDRGQKVFALFSRLPASELSGASLLELRIYETDLFGLISRGGPQYQIYVLNDDGTVMSSTNRSLLGLPTSAVNGPERQFLQIKQGLEYKAMDGVEYVAAKGVTDNGWSVVAAVEVTGLVRDELREVNHSILLISLVSILLALLLTVIFSSRLNKRMVMLNKKIQLIRKGEFDRDIPIPGTDEFSMLSTAMDATRAELKLLIHEIKEEGEQRQKAEMDALRSQINTHFIFNTLSGIRRMVVNRDMLNVREAIDVLSSFFRISLSSRGDFISVGKELEHLQSYIYLQKMRYDDDIDIQVQADEETLAYTTVRLVLQPMVENAIFHGRRIDGRVLHIVVSARIRGDKLVYEVADDGAGISPERLVDIQRGEVQSRTYGGYGISNVDRRIRLIQGLQYGIDIASEAGVGTTVIITQPLKPIQMA